MDSNVDLVAKAIKAANRKPISAIDIVRATGLTKRQARTAADRAVKCKARNIVRLAKGVFCYDPPEGTKAYETRFEAAMHLLRENGEMSKEELASKLNISKEKVHEVVSRARRAYDLKVKRHVVYRLEK